jgi:NADPH2:quinone reductase
MKAIRIQQTGGPEVLQSEEIPTPEPREGQLLVKVSAAGVNFADIAQRRGAYLTPTRVPTVLGVEVAGTVEALGPGVSGPAVGTRVAALVSGGYAEYAIAVPAAVIPIPNSLDFVRAAALPVQGLTAYQLLRDSARIEPGESVLVHAAAGGVGTLAVQLARLMGASQVVATAGSIEKLELARRLGADTLVNYRDADWAAQVLQATGQKGVNIILEMVGGDVTKKSLDLLTEFSGRLVIFGAASGERAEIGGAKLMQRNIAVIGYWLSPYISQSDKIGRAVGDLFGYLSAGKLEIIVGQTFPLADAAKAHIAMEGRATTGKIVLTI